MTDTYPEMGCREQEVVDNEMISWYYMVSTVQDYFEKKSIKACRSTLYEVKWEIAIYRSDFKAGELLGATEQICRAPRKQD